MPLLPGQPAWLVLPDWASQPKPWAKSRTSTVAAFFIHFLISFKIINYWKFL
jgi:hypothetical protein